MLKVVVTAASSGIGRATAEAFAAEGAKIVIAARSADALEEVADTCRAKGAEVLVVPTDVGDADAVAALAQAAREYLGGIDLWASIAGVGALGKYQDTPMSAHEAVIRTNLLGHMHEAHAALPIFLAQERGVFVNMISLGGFASTPFAAAYGASKFGLRGFAEALRGELAAWPDIHVCDIYPAAVDTPAFRHAGNYTGKELSAPPPVVDARRVAAAIVRLARHPRDTTLVGSQVYAIRLGHLLAPNLVAKSMNGFIATYLEKAGPAEVTDGNLFDAPEGPRPVDGGLRKPPSQRLGIGLALAGVAAAVGAAAFLRTNRGKA